VLSQDVFSPGIGRARVSPVVPHLYRLPSFCFGDIRFSCLLLIHPENPHEILARDIEAINQYSCLTLFSLLAELNRKSGRKFFKKIKRFFNS
jgi:hypothetical protein